MPYAAKRPCKTHGCSALVDRGHCEVHSATAKAIEPARPTAAQRGYGARWQKARRLYLVAHPLCVDPHSEHGERVVAAMCVDHIIPHCGDMALFWDPSNWQPLCKRCHDVKTASQDGGFGR
jgi:5-methylcytosine-specific restriction protein A